MYSSFPSWGRRRFLSSLALSSLGIGLGVGALPRTARGQSEGPDLLLTFEARGGWDSTAFADPYSDDVFSVHFAEEDILTVPGTDITYAPKEPGVPYLVDGADFFVKHANEMLVVRGVNMQTNSHSAGQRHAFSGKLATGNPNISAMVAAKKEADLDQVLALGFMSNGGFSATSNLLVASRFGNVDAFRALVEPMVIDPVTGPDLYRPRAVTEAIWAAEQQRRTTSPATLLPSNRRSRDAFEGARLAEGGFDEFSQALNELPALPTATQSNPLVVDARLAIAAMKSGQCSAAHLALDGFDTHGNHHPHHMNLLQQLTEGVSYAIDTLKAEGLWSRTIVMIGSDFGRTTYNARVGKDHWPINTYMFFGEDIGGGRVIGATTNGRKEDGTYLGGAAAQKVKVEGGSIVVADPDDVDAGYLQPLDLMRALRAQFGLQDHPISANFSLGAGDFGQTVLPFFA